MDEAHHTRSSLAASYVLLQSLLMAADIVHYCHLATGSDVSVENWDPQHNVYVHLGSIHQIYFYLHWAV